MTLLWYLSFLFMDLFLQDPRESAIPFIYNYQFNSSFTSLKERDTTGVG